MISFKMFFMIIHKELDILYKALWFYMKTRFSVTLLYMENNAKYICGCSTMAFFSCIADLKVFSIYHMICF